jgi:hypothetical protein
MFKEHQLRFDAPARLRARENFSENLEDILRAGHRAGVPVVLSTVASNLKDCAPFASPHKLGANTEQFLNWFKTGIQSARPGGT